MDCFEAHYYQLNRKLLLLVGQWPYQNFADRVKRWILYLCIVLPASGAQVARVVTSDIDFDTCIEIISDELTFTLTLIRYFTYTINNRKVTSLLDNMKMNWQFLMSIDEIEIFCKTAEEGRLYSLHYMMYFCMIIAATTLLLFSPPLIEHMNLTNSSFSHLSLFPAEYFLDNEKYYYLTLVHLYLVIIVSVAGLLATDLLFMVFMYHSVGMFKVTCYRLEHAFDHCNAEVDDVLSRTKACQKMASAVGYHRRALSFCEALGMAYGWTNFASLILALMNITVSLYWAIVSKAQISKMIIGLMLCAGQMLHMLAVHIPAQMITDNSMDVSDKVYSSLWYNAHVKEQTLLLLTMHRGLKPCHMLMGGFYPMSIENYASEVKAAFSYFTVLMSLK